MDNISTTTIKLHGQFLEKLLKSIHTSLQTYTEFADLNNPNRELFEGESIWNSWNENNKFLSTTTRPAIVTLVTGKTKLTTRNETTPRAIIDTIFDKVPILKTIYSLQQDPTHKFYFIQRSSNDDKIRQLADDHFPTSINEPSPKDVTPPQHDKNKNKNKKGGAASAWIDVNKSSVKSFKPPTTTLASSPDDPTSTSGSDDNQYASLLDSDNIITDDNDDDNDEQENEYDEAEKRSQKKKGAISSSNKIRRNDNSAKSANDKDVIDEDDVRKLKHLIQTFQHHDIDIDTLTSWIEEKNFRPINDQLQQGIATLNNTTSDAIDDLHQHHSNISKEYHSTNAKCKGQLHEARKLANNAVNDIKKETSIGITSVASRINEGITHIKLECDKAKKTTIDLKSSSKFADSQTTAMNQLLKYVNLKVQTETEQFQSSLSALVDEAQEEFGEFIEQYTTVIHSVNDKSKELDYDKELLLKEREMLEREKEMIKEQKEMLLEWKKKQSEMEAIYTEKIDEMQSWKQKWLNGTNDGIQHSSPGRHAMSYNSIHEDLSMDNSCHNHSCHSHHSIGKNKEHESLKNPPVTNIYHPNDNAYDKRGLENIPLRQFMDRERISYKMAFRTVVGTVIDAGYHNSIHPKVSSWKYTIEGDDGHIYVDCQERLLSKATSLQPPSSAVSYILNQGKKTNTTYEDHNNHTPTSNKQPTHLLDDQFIFPKDSTYVTRIYSQSIEKYGSTWTYDLTNEKQIPDFYEKLRLKMKSCNILLRPYNELKMDEDICVINENNSINASKARKTMAEILYNYLDDNKSTIFEHYPIALGDITACKHTHDGFQVLIYIVEVIHPLLKNRTKKKKSNKPPLGKDCKTVIDLVSQYEQWLEEELMKGRTYDEEDQILYIVGELDERYATAKTKIDLRLEDLTKDKDMSFPSELKVNHKLGKYILDLLTVEEKKAINDDAYSNTSGHLNKMNMTDRLYSNSNQSKKKGKFKSFQSYSSKERRKDNKKYGDSWANEIKWKIIPGAICSACGGSNHEVYETGCPQLARFSNCKEFMQRHSPEQIKPVVESYNEYVRDRRRQRQNTKKGYRRTIKSLEADEEMDDKGLAHIKQLYEQDYYDQYPEESYNDDVDIFNPSDDESEEH